MNSRPIFGIRLLSLFVLLLLAVMACGPATTEQAAEPSATAAPANSGDQDRPLITVTTTNAPDENNPEEVARHKLLIEAFKEVRPDVVIEEHQGGFNKETFSAKLAAGTMEDAFLVPFTEPQDLLAKGYIADLTEILSQWEHFDEFNPNVLRLVQNQQGHVYGIPVSAYAQGLVYNRKLFAEAGLDPNQPPRTWDELREYAKALTDPAKGRAGFAELSSDNQGGWHFTIWVYSSGGDLQRFQDGKWQATFTDDTAVQALQTIKDMRWVDKSLTEQQLLAVKDVLPLLANEQVAMAILAPDSLRSLKTQYEANIEDFGMGPLPQHGGNATLTGGQVWVFNPKSSPEVLQAAVEWTLFRDFGLETFETDLKTQQERGQLVGWPQIPLFTGDFQKQRDALVAKYANAPLDYYKPYIEAGLQLRPAPPIETQKMYGILDTVMQAVLTDPQADPKQVLDEAAKQFQTQVLDQVKP